MLIPLPLVLLTNFYLVTLFVYSEGVSSNEVIVSLQKGEDGEEEEEFVKAD